MPERTPTATPQVMIGSTLMSGDPNTGQVLFTQGGSKTYTKHSGTAGGAAVIFTGAGRLDWIQFHPSVAVALSGISQTLFDAAAAASGHDGSGSKVLLKVAMPALLGAVAPAISLASGMTFPGSPPMQLGVPFTSGLCHSSASGNPGFTVGYTAVVSG